MAARKQATVIRGGRLLDARAHRAPRADILILGDTVAEVGRPGLAAPEGARVIDARRRLLHPGLINAHTHGHGALAKGMGDAWTLELLLTAAPWISGARAADPGCRGDAAQGLHGLLRPSFRVAAAERRRHGCDGRRLCRDGHARRPRADDRRPLLLPGHAGSRGRADAGAPGRRGAVSDEAPAGHAGGHAPRPRGLASAPRRGPPGRRPHHPAPLQRRLPRRLGAARARIRRGLAQPRLRVQGPGRRRHPLVRQHADRAPRFARCAGTRVHRRPRRVARPRRHAPAGGPRRLGRAQSGQQHASRLGPRGFPRHAGGRRQSRHRHRRRPVRR